MTAEQLRSVLDIDHEIRCIEERIMLLETYAEKITTTWSDMPKGTGVADKIGDCASEIADERTELCLLIAERQRRKKAIEKLAESTGDWKTREAITLRYIHGYSLVRIAEMVGMSLSGLRKRMRKFMEDNNVEHSIDKE